MIKKHDIFILFVVQRGTFVDPKDWTYDDLSQALGKLGGARERRLASKLLRESLSG